MCDFRNSTACVESARKRSQTKCEVFASERLGICIGEHLRTLLPVSLQLLYAYCSRANAAVCIRTIRQAAPIMATTMQLSSPKRRSPVSRKKSTWMCAHRVDCFLAALILPFNKIMSSELRVREQWENLGRANWSSIIWISRARTMGESRSGKLIFYFIFIIFNTSVWLSRLNSFCREWCLPKKIWPTFVAGFL